MIKREKVQDQLKWQHDHHFTYMIDCEDIGQAIDFKITNNFLEYKIYEHLIPKNKKIPISFAAPVNSTKTPICDVLSGKIGKIGKIGTKKRSLTRLHILIVIK